ncbi:MAG: hypothetical protein AAF604_04870 [Acidobacteriota bacterium]
MHQEWPVVKTFGTEEEAALVAGFLRSRDLPVEVDSRLFRQEPVTFGALGDVRLRVPPEHVEEAKRLLAQAEADLEVLEKTPFEDDEQEPDESP